MRHPGSGHSGTARLAVLVALCLAGLIRLSAIYVEPDLANVPVDRAIQNLERLAAENPKDAGLRLNLARAHAMAFAKAGASFDVDQRTQKVWFGFSPKHVPAAPAPTPPPSSPAAREHLRKAIAAYDATLALEPDDLTAQLGRAWSLEQAGERAKAIEGYRAVIARGWERERTLQSLGPGAHSLVREASDYLIPLLDPARDRDELETLQARRAQIARLPRAITPIAIPLRDGLTAQAVSDPRPHVRFDADGSGAPKLWTWITPDAGWLVYDQRGNGQITSALQMFGSVTFWMFWHTGYDALQTLDDDGDGALADDELRHLAVWRDANRDGISDPGEVQPLDDWGIVSLAIDHELDPSHPDEIAWSPAGVTLRDGTTRPTWDLVLYSRPTLRVRFGR